jgi:signal transduction histidine kinase/DNA-binding response OmpR family regulator/ligand-binding sensor domain-containing protein
MRQLSVNEGLPQGQVRGIVQDRQGFIWLATEGLSRYDGRTFLNYSNVFGNKASLAGDLVLDLSIDDNDDIWMVYDSKEVDLINAASGKVRHLSTEPAFRWLQQQRPLFRIDIRQAGGRFFTVNSRELMAFDKVTGKHQVISLPPGEEILALGGNVRDKALLATTRAVYEIQGAILKEQFSLPPFPDNLHNTPLSAERPFISIGQIMEYAGGNLAITALDGICVYNKSMNSCSFYGGKQPIGRMPYSIVRATDGNVYYMLFDGLYRLSGNSAPQLIFSNSPALSVNNFLLADRSGMLWASAGLKGILLIDMAPVNFHSLPQHNSFATDVLQNWMINPDTSLTYDSYQLRSAKDKYGNNWVLTKPIRTNTDGSVNRFISANLYRFQGNRLTLAGAAPGNYTKVYFTFDGHNQCWEVLLDTLRKKRLLVKTNLQRQNFTPFVELPAGWKENGYLAAIDRYVAYLTDNELRLYDTATAACIIYPKGKLGIGGFLLMALPDLQNKNILWLATKGSGIVKLDIATGAVQHYTMANGLPNNTVYFMAPDKKGFFWCSSNKGLFRFYPADGSVVAFTVKDGLQGNEFNRYHFLETPDGHFCFGGTEGYTYFHPDSVHLDQYQPPVAITGLQVNNIPIQQLDSFWKDDITSSLQSISLPYYQNQLSFSFAGLQYNAPEKLQYRYRLGGIDKDWIYAGYNANASYAAIPPGRYTLLVNASNTAGRWSNYIKELEITIRPPWWRTWWMYIIYGLLLAGAIYLFIRIRLRRLQLKQQVVLKQKEAEQAQALEEAKSRFFANITHELRTPLTLILTPVQRQLQEDATTYSPQLLAGVYKNSQMLLRLINQLLDMSKLEGGNMPVNLHRGDVVSFIQSLLPPFQQQADARRIGFQFQATGIGKEYLFDSDKLEKMLHNLLGNAFKFTPGGGRITVMVTTKENSTGATFQVRVSDTGIGIAPEHLPHIFDRFYQVNASTTRKYEGTGIGLSLVREFAGLMGGSIDVESKPGDGSVFTLILPFAAATGNEALAVIQPDLIADAPIETAAPEEQAEKPLVLVTDDNEQLRNFIRDILSPHYRILTAINGEAGLQIATSELPELIISDVMMPVMDGYEFCQKIKQAPLTSHIGFILLTAKTADESRISGLRLGADHYMSKPFMVEEMLLVVNNLLKRQQRLREHYSQQLLQPAESLPPVNEVEDDFLRSVYAVIEKNLDSDKLDVDFLAAELALSRRTLNRKLSAIADTSASAMIRNYRLKKAAALLLQGYTVNEAAYATGFSTHSWFSQCFKEMYDMTPLQYAQQGGLAQN